MHSNIHKIVSADAIQTHNVQLVLPKSVPLLSVV